MFCGWVHQKPCGCNVVCLAAAGGFGPAGIGNSSVVVAVCLAIECMGCSAEGIEHFVGFGGLANHYPSPLLYLYKWGNLVLIHISLLSALVPQWHGGSLFFGAVPQLLLWE